MRILVLGSGAREHAISWAYSNSKRVSGLFIAPGNAGTADLGENLPQIDPCNREQVLNVIKEKKINFVFVGPEAPLEAGIVNYIKEAGIAVIGPEKEAAQLEASKSFAKDFMLRHNIPTADARNFSDLDDFKAYIKQGSGMRVIKKNGLAAGKGVLESDDNKKLIDFGSKILKNDTVLVEEFLEGYEVSLFVLSDGKNYRILPTASDFKKSGENDTGLNTGGMGSISPVPWVNEQTIQKIEKEIVQPTINGLNKDGLNYKGVVYIGLMMTKKGVKVLEYNVRFGDPETQVVIPLIKSDFGDLTSAMAEGKLADFPLNIHPFSAVGVVVAAEGYPGLYQKGTVVEKLPEMEPGKNLLFHASTIKDETDKVKTNGGRCFTVVGIGSNTVKARSQAYAVIDKVQFTGSWYRKDIGNKFLLEDV